MISVERTKEIIKKLDLSNEEAEKIRDSFRALAEVIFDEWKRSVE